MIDLNIMVGGEAGQGVQSVGSVLAKTLLRGGYEIFADQDFESRIRGGHSFSRVRVSRQPISAAVNPIDVLVALNEETIGLHKKEVQRRGIIVSDNSKTSISRTSHLTGLGIPFEKIAISVSGNTLMTNTVAAGSILGLLEYDFSPFEAVLRGEYGRKGVRVAQANVDAGRAGYDFALQHRPNSFKLRLKSGKPSGKMLISGHEALALGVLASGCKFVAGYPMTPTTSILELLADKGRKYGLHVVQAEDEISAVNMAVGAAYTGVRSMTATSGGGFCLMTETLSLAGMTETPLVVILGQRSGPAIGLPTRTEQGDLLFALHAGHGEFPRALLAPGNAEEAFWAAVKAFNLAEAFQTPVIILTDHDLGNSYYTMRKPDLAKVVVDRGKALSDTEAAEAADYKRYAYTRTGISPRAFPGQGKALVVADSDEHNEDGHIIEDARTRRKMMDKRMRKNIGLSRKIAGPSVILRGSPIYNLICWGSTFGAVAEAARVLEQRGILAQVTHVRELWPFPSRAFTQTLTEGAKNIVIETNFTGQLENLIRAETGFSADGHVRKYDGRPFTAEEIVTAIEGMVLR